MPTPVINLHKTQMAEALGFSVDWLEQHQRVLMECGAIQHEGRWHIGSTEAAFCQAQRKGLLGKGRKSLTAPVSNRTQNT